MNIDLFRRAHMLLSTCGIMANDHGRLRQVVYLPPLNNNISYIYFDTQMVQSSLKNTPRLTPEIRTHLGMLT